MVVVFGLGFVGLTAALGFAEVGFQVYGFDENLELIRQLEEGVYHGSEPHIDRMLLKHVNRNLILSADLSDAIQKSDYIFLCVGTPCAEDGSADLGAIINCVNSIKQATCKNDNPKCIIIKSTVPPGTADSVSKNHFKDSNDFFVVSNPEFLREGHCWDDFIAPGRIVVGTSNPRAQEKMGLLYKPFASPVHYTTSSGAEFIKYMSNSLLATMISFSNEMAHMAEQFGSIDVKQAFSILHEDQRLKGSGIASYIYPGCGYGGYCLPKDVQAIVSAAGSAGFFPPLLEAANQTNRNVSAWWASKIMGETPQNGTVGFLGLSFKPESDDVRESPAAKIMSCLQQRNDIKLAAYDPISIKNFSKMYGEFPVTYFHTASELILNSDIIFIATAWNEFLTLDYKNMKVIDGRYCL